MNLDELEKLKKISEYWEREARFLQTERTKLENVIAAIREALSALEDE